MKVKVDGEVCTGHGRCYSMAPSVYQCDDEGYNTARDKVIDVPPDLEEAILRSVRGCPEGAIKLLEP